jgi:hypothetical protein
VFVRGLIVSRGLLCFNPRAMIRAPGNSCEANYVFADLRLYWKCGEREFLESIHSRARVSELRISLARGDEFVLLDGKFALYGLPTPLENCLILCHQIVVCSADETTLGADLCSCIARLLIFTGAANVYGVLAHL